VLDLRANGGGLLTEAVLVSSLFVEDGLIVSTKGRNRAEQKFDAQGSALAPDLPMVTLVDGGSASASEIVTGALRDKGRATVVGEKTYGKGVFQEVKFLSDDSILELTVGSYFLPKGDNLAQNGIAPQVKARDLPKTRRDEALPIAVERVAQTAR
jgi:carboxyl-terminal processing protease